MEVLLRNHIIFISAHFFDGTNTFEAGKCPYFLLAGHHVSFMCVSAVFLAFRLSVHPSIPTRFPDPGWVLYRGSDGAPVGSDGA